LAGEMEETPKEPSPLIDHFLIGSNLKILEKGRERAEALGIPTRIMSSRLRGEAREVAKAILAIGEEIATTGHPFAPPVCLLFGGETTVTLKGDGMGGRNQEMALAVLREFQGNPRFLFLSAGTDGIDGHSDAAGALVDHTSWEKAKELGLRIDDYLARNDSYHFFRETGDLIMTGPTGTNVMDMTALLITA
ncbi:MAG: MOFRL family protein, partial [Syntrophales bacterium]